MKKYLYVGVAVIVTLLSLLLINQCNKAAKYQRLYNRELQNVEAYQLDNSAMQDEIRQYKMSIDELYASRDSVDQKLLKTMEELKIKDKQIQDLQYSQTQITKTDTLRIHDTIFSEGVSIDTTLGDYWFSTRLQFKFPSTVIVTPTCNSEQYVYIFNKKEYNKEPSKIFFIRWFQKKHVVTEVKIEEKNPYIKIVKQKFIKVE